ncbi:hypothetical protein ACKVV1_000133 [Pyricularia oryzae]
MATTGSFRYLDPSTLGNTDSGKPWSKVDVDATSWKRISIERPVHDMRAEGLENFTTDNCGFSVFHHPAAEKDFTDDKAVRGGYYSEVESLLKEKLPAIKKIVIFDHTIRRRTPDSPRQPVQAVHVDQTPAAAETRLRRHVTDPAEAEELIKGRYQIINVWRPIGWPASDYPLAVIDWRSTEPKDLVAVDLLYPKRQEGEDDDDRGKEVLADPASLASMEGYEVRGETYAIAPNDKHKFYYAKDMTPDEVMFIKCFDSRSEGRPNGREGLAALTPHTAFVDPATPPDAKGRQSIEVRCLVFYDQV